MAINLGKGPAKGVPLEGLKKAAFVHVFLNESALPEQAEFLEKSVSAASSDTACSGSAVYSAVHSTLLL